MLFQKFLKTIQKALPLERVALFFKHFAFFLLTREQYSAKVQSKIKTVRFFLPSTKEFNLLNILEKELNYM